MKGWKGITLAALALCALLAAGVFWLKASEIGRASCRERVLRLV